MKLFQRILGLIAIVVAALAFAPTANANAVFNVICAYDHSRQADPIVSPGIYPSAHLHDFFGNRSTDEFSTLSSLLAAPTDCKDQADHSGYWVPALYYHGVKQPAPKVQVYYHRSQGTPIAEPPPAGLTMLAGDSHATGPQPIKVVSWHCKGTTADQNHPLNCGTNTLDFTVGFPNCWSGAGLTPATLTYPGQQGICPAMFPHVLPKVRTTYHTSIHDGSTGVSFSSGPYYTLHGDAFLAWQQAHLNALLCTHHVTCA